MVNLFDRKYFFQILKIAFHKQRVAVSLKHTKLLHMNDMSQNSQDKSQLNLI